MACSVIIDADSIVYIACASKKREKKTLKTCKKQVDSIIGNILLKSKADKYLCVLTTSRCFRYNIYPEYKQHRKKLEKPMYFTEIQSYLIKKYNAFSYPGLEADDVVRIIQKNTENCIIASPDKDMINLEGICLNYRLWTITNTTKEEEEIYFWRSMCTGDTADNIKGIPGKGESYFNNTILPKDNSLRNSIFNEYIAYFGEYKGIEEFYKNYKCLYILNELDGFEIPKLIEYKQKDVWEIEEENI